MDNAKLIALAEICQAALCKTEEHARDGSRENPMWDYWGQIQERMEDALGIEKGTLLEYGQGAACEDEDCDSC